MKCEINARGDIVITPENRVERYALDAWATAKCDSKYAGSFIIDLTPPPMPPTMPSDQKYVKVF